MMASMKLEPYTVPEQDADLWGCGVVLDPSPPVEVRAWNSRPTGRDRLVWAAMCERESATFAELLSLTGASPRVVGTSLMRLASVGIVRPVGDVALCSNNGVSVRSCWTLCGPEEASQYGLAWRARVKHEQDERAAEAEAYRAKQEAVRKATWEAGARERAEAFAKGIEDGTVPVRTLPNGTRIVGSALSPDPKPR